MREFSEELGSWRGKRYQKEVASLLGVKLGTFRSWENGKKTPNKFALAEIRRLMAAAIEKHHEPKNLTPAAPVSSPVVDSDRSPETGLESNAVEQTPRASN